MEDALYIFLIEYGNPYIIRAQKSCKSRSSKIISLSLKTLLKEHPSVFHASQSQL